MVKHYKKSLSDPNNYRGISLIPILTKLLELLIIVKYPNITTHKNNQFGFKSQSSTMHAAFSVKETVNHYNDRNTLSLYVVWMQKKHLIAVIGTFCFQIYLQNANCHKKLFPCFKSYIHPVLPQSYMTI